MASLATILMVLIPQVVLADQQGYCNRLVDPFTRCDGAAIGVASHNEARYPGAGTVSVCERVESGNQLLSRNCANNAVGSGAELYPYYNNDILMRLYVGNNSSNRHTINGNAVGYDLSSF